MLRRSTGLASALALVVGATAACHGGGTGERPADSTDPPSVGVLPHATDFLTAGCYTHVYGGLDSASRESCRAAMKSRNYTHFYLYVYNEHDYGGPAFDFFEAPDRFRALLAELRNARLEPVVWLVPDDAPALMSQPVDRLLRRIERLVPAIDDLVSSYVVGLELDEYWPPATTDRVGTRLSQLTDKPIAVHQTPGRWDYCAFRWCDYMILQYGFDVGPDDIERMTRTALRALGKPVVAGEYEAESEARAVARGARGVAAGAAGFGNAAPVTRPD